MKAEKFFLKSKTIWGIIVMIIPSLGPLLGISFGADEAALITQTGDSVISAFGALLATWGRFAAGGIKI